MEGRPVTLSEEKRPRKAAPVWLGVGIALVISLPCTVLGVVAVIGLFGTDERVVELIVAEDGTLYYTLETYESGDSSGVESLWRRSPGDAEPEPISKPMEDVCGREEEQFADWHHTPDGVAATVQCRFGSTLRAELWGYSAELSRVSLIHADATVSSPRDRLYAGPGALYGAWISNSPCSEVYVDALSGDELGSRQISGVLAAAAGVEESDSECFGGLEAAHLRVDQEGDLWIAFKARGGQRVCEYDLMADAAVCGTLDLVKCSGFVVSRDGSRFACGDSTYTDDTEHVAVFDAATAEPIAELEFASEGAWNFSGNDTIAVLDDDLELAIHSID
jgi:hypothetical protein